MTTIKLKNGSGAPLAGDLVVGEPALDLTNKRLYTEDSGGTVIEVGTNPTSVTTGTLTTTGNVGIGTSSPVGPLSLQGDAGTNGKEQGILLKYSNGTEYGAFGLNNSSGWPQLMARAGAGITFHTNSDLLTTNEAMRIDASGRLLVGTTGANYSGVDLTVGDTVDSQNGIAIQSSTTGYGHVLFGDGTGTDAYRGQISYKHGDDFLAMYTAGSEAMRIDASGNVGIGTSSPNTPLQVSGANSSTNADAIFSVQKTTEGYGLFSGVLPTGVSWLQGGTSDDATYYNVALQPNGGNVGIGTSSPSLKGHINGASSGLPATSGTTQTNGVLRLSSSATSGIIDFGMNSANPWIQATDSGGLNNNYNLLLNPNGGNVGIGVSNPSSYSANANNLVIGGEANVGMHFDSNSSTGNGGIYFSDQTAVKGILAYSHTDDAMQFFTNGTTERMRILSSGGITFNGDTATANALADYEEGTWSPTIGTNNGDASITVGNSTGYYTKIGNVVTLTWYSNAMNVTSIGTGIAVIGNLPFTASNGSIEYGVANCTHTTVFNATGGYIGPNGTLFIPIQTGTANGVSLIAGNPKYVMFEASYRTV